LDDQGDVAAAFEAGIQSGPPPHQSRSGRGSKLDRSASSWISSGAAPPWRRRPPRPERIGVRGELAWPVPHRFVAGAAPPGRRQMKATAAPGDLPLQHRQGAARQSRRRSRGEAALHREAAARSRAAKCSRSHVRSLSTNVTVVRVCYLLPGFEPCALGTAGPVGTAALRKFATEDPEAHNPPNHGRRAAPDYRRCVLRTAYQF
jgi:hypothetical protein